FHFPRSFPLLGRAFAKHRARAEDHIRLAMPELPPAEVSRIAKASMQSLAMLAIEVLFTPRLITKWTWAQYVIPINMPPPHPHHHAARPPPPARQARRHPPPRPLRQLGTPRLHPPHLGLRYRRRHAPPRQRIPQRLPHGPPRLQRPPSALQKRRHPVHERRP